MSADLKIENGIVSLMQLNPLKVKIEVNEKELPLIHKGNEVEVAFDAYPEEKVIGKIHYISPVLSSVTRTSSVEVEIPNTSLKFKPGMFAGHRSNCLRKKVFLCPLMPFTGNRVPVKNLYLS